MSGNAMRLKAKIRNLARNKDMSAQVILQNSLVLHKIIGSRISRLQSLISKKKK